MPVSLNYYVSKQAGQETHKLFSCYYYYLLIFITLILTQPIDLLMILAKVVHKDRILQQK